MQNLVKIERNSDSQQNKSKGKLALKVVGSLAIVGTAALVGLSYMNQGAQDVGMESNSATFLGESNDQKLESQEMMRSFQNFVNRHNKNYLTKSEFNARLSIFSQNMGIIKVHNKQANAEGFQMGVNKFTDYSSEEFGKLLGFKSDGLIEEEPIDDGSVDPEEFNTNGQSESQEYESLDDQADDQQPEEGAQDPNGGGRRLQTALPASVDWRTSGAVSSVKNQGQCGSCYSFTALASIESAMKIAKGGVMQDYSEQQLVDCTATAYYGNFGCGGGNMNQCFKYLQQYKLMNESVYPYAGVKKACAYNATKGTLVVKSYTNVAQNDPDAHMAAVALKPVSIALSAATSTFQFYKSGIISSTACGTTVNHAVLLIGYGKDALGTPYWLIKNSWGASWGESGFVRIKRSTVKGTGGICNPLTMSSYPTVL
eukprot:403352207